ncbi:hypothetical protein TEK04_02410 [Klenkia sp. LSe6-5]|uniref:Uncharacterized protein n=1 Tax=Klenkia sesuvii TaxID=3103137 RepID=A0ABU8DP22_9ACTN
MRRGWVSVEDAAGGRWWLAVFDDGWVELPARDQQPSGPRAQLRQLAVLVGAFGLLVLLSQMAGRFDGAGPAGAVVFGVGALALLLFSAVQVARSRARDRTSAGYAERFDGARRVGSAQVGAVVVTGPDRPAPQDPLVVSVLLHDGGTLTYRTPDPAARDLFAPWTSLT